MVLVDFFQHLRYLRKGYWQNSFLKKTISQLFCAFFDNWTVDYFFLCAKRRRTRVKIMVCIRHLNHRGNIFNASRCLATVFIMCYFILCWCVNFGTCLFLYWVFSLHFVNQFNSKRCLNVSCIGALIRRCLRVTAYNISPSDHFFGVSSSLH